MNAELSLAIARADTRTDFEHVELPIALAERRVRIENFEQANKAHKLVNSSRELAIEIGRFLVNCKAELKHGEWLAYVRANCNFSAKHVERYMNIYRYRDAMPTQENFSFRACDDLIRSLENKAPRTKREITVSSEVAKLLKKFSVEELRAELDRVDNLKTTQYVEFQLVA